LTQIYAHHHKQFLKTKAESLGSNMIPGQAIGSQVSCADGNTTTTVVVTDDKSETETIIEGKNLPVGANEMIMIAATSAPTPTTTSAKVSPLALLLLLNFL